MADEPVAKTKAVPLAATEGQSEVLTAFERECTRRVSLLDADAAVEISCMAMEDYMEDLKEDGTAMDQIALAVPHTCASSTTIVSFHGARATVKGAAPPPPPPPSAPPVRVRGAAPPSVPRAPPPSPALPGASVPLSGNGIDLSWIDGVLL